LILATIVAGALLTFREFLISKEPLKLVGGFGCSIFYLLVLTVAYLNILKIWYGLWYHTYFLVTYCYFIILIFLLFTTWNDPRVWSFHIFRLYAYVLIAKLIIFRLLVILKTWCLAANAKQSGLKVRNIHVDFYGSLTLTYFYFVQ